MFRAIGSAITGKVEQHGLDLMVDYTHCVDPVPHIWFYIYRKPLIRRYLRSWVAIRSNKITFGKGAAGDDVISKVFFDLSDPTFVDSIAEALVAEMNAMPGSATVK